MASGCNYMRYLEAIARSYPTLTPMERSIECFLNSQKSLKTAFICKGIGRTCSATVPEFCVEVADVFEL